VETREVGLDDLAFGAVCAVARRGARVDVSPEARERARASRRHIERTKNGNHAVYGVTTGFGALATVLIPPEERRELQHAILRSHAAGMGPFVEPEIVRAMMLIRAKTLAKGHSGVQPELVDALIAMLNFGVTLAVPEHGSLGASGDLAPLAHVDLCLAGEGWALEGGEAAPARDALEKARLKPVELEAKEGLALVRRRRRSSGRPRGGSVQNLLGTSA
jgi:histidine ammonia-lyase